MRPPIACEALQAPRDPRKHRLLRIHREDTRKGEEQLTAPGESNLAEQQRPYSARLAAMDGEKQRRIAAHDEIGSVCRSRVDVATLQIGRASCRARVYS